MKRKPDLLKQFVLPFIGLKDGKHEFEIEIETAFFEYFDFQGITASTLRLDLGLEKRPNMLILDFKIFGTVEVECDRCAEPVDLPMNINHTLYVKFGEEDADHSEDVIVLSDTAHDIDISHFTYEFINLAMPYKRVHEEGQCDPEAIKKLNELLVKNEDQQVDPRWDKLKGLLNKNN